MSSRRPRPSRCRDRRVRLRSRPASRSSISCSARAKRVTAPQQEAFDSLWPKRGGREGQPDPRLEVARAPAAGAAPQAAPAAEAAPPPPAPAPQARTVAILKSGVVDGMAYTLYADGSIEAQLPQGTVRFGSIAELRAHIENNG